MRTKVQSSKFKAGQNYGVATPLPSNQPTDTLKGGHRTAAVELESCFGNWRRLLGVQPSGCVWSFYVSALQQARRARRARQLRLARESNLKHRTQGGSAFIIVLWIAFGLVSVCLYFASSMTMELRASENRLANATAEQAIEGAARYINNILAWQCSYGSNGVVPDPSSYVCEAVPVGEARFWLIGRDTNSSTLSFSTTPAQISYGLIDEGSKLNLNTTSSNIFSNLVTLLPYANQDLPTAIVDWRSTNATGIYQSYYSTQIQPYQNKAAPFETIDELRLVYGGDMMTLVGEDLNRNGILDANEDSDHNGMLQPGILEYVTVYSKEPNTRTNGDPKINISTLNGSTGPLPDLLNTALGSTRAQAILQNLGLLNNSGAAQPGGGGGNTGGQGGPGGGGPPAVQVQTFTSPLQFYRRSQMTSDEFARICNDITITATNNAYIEGRVNINTANANVLAGLPGLSSDANLAQTLITYRQSNPDKLGSIAWVVDALGSSNSSALDALQAVDAITAQSFQFTADIAAVGPRGRGYRRERIVFDTCTGTPRIVYRQDLTGLGWALGKDVREKLTSLAQNTTF
jgi:type II secretory pathway component PulK